VAKGRCESPPVQNGQDVAWAERRHTSSAGRSGAPSVRLAGRMGFPGGHQCFNVADAYGFAGTVHAGARDCQPWQDRKLRGSEHALRIDL